MVSPKWISIKKILIFDNFIIVEHRRLMINSIDAYIDIVFFITSYLGYK